MITRDRFDAVLFDMDGVLTPTSDLHAASWKAMFDPWLKARAARRSEPFQPFDVAGDYIPLADGRNRYDGVRAFLQSRGIAIPEGSPEDPPGTETVCGLGNRKNSLLVEMLESGGIEAYPGSVALVRRLRSRGIRTAVVSASHNAEAVLAGAGIAGLFDARIDGNDADRGGLEGKPSPDTYLAAARRLGVEPSRAAVVEDAIAGVRAGRAGGFALVIGVDRRGAPEALIEAGADIVVCDLGELLDPGH